MQQKYFKITLHLPRSEDYGLTSQIRRSSNSIAANIAEGYGRNTKKDKSNIYIIARSSAFETQSHLFYGLKIGYFETETINKIHQDYTGLHRACGGFKVLSCPTKPKLDTKRKSCWQPFTLHKLDALL